MLRDGADGVGPIPASRWDADALRNLDIPRRGGFLESVDQFDADFFGISPREAVFVDPQHRLLLELAWEALEDGGQVPERWAGARVGVFVGIATNDYAQLQAMRGGASDGYRITGCAASIAANRISHYFDFRGPSLAIDTACSSSLVAVHLACRSLRDGESDLAMAGGVNLILLPEVLASFKKAGFLSAEGRCKTFDSQADGYVRGEGAGMVVLKPLSRALADGDRIYAVIRGGAINQDGRSNGLTAPNRRRRRRSSATRTHEQASRRVSWISLKATVPGRSLAIRSSWRRSGPSWPRGVTQERNVLWARSRPISVTLKRPPGSPG